MIIAIEENLKKGITLLRSISDEQYANHKIPPYFSSIGCHTRHILDVYSCIFNGLETNIDLTDRKRNKEAEEKTSVGIDYFNEIISKLNLLENEDLDKEVIVFDDLGKGKQKATYTLKAILMQAQSHTTHHYSTIGFLIHHLGIELPDNSFGFNPTTPNKTLKFS